MLERAREMEIKTQMKNAKRDREAGVVREMTGTSMLIYVFLFFFVSPYPLKASAGCPAFSVLLFFLLLLYFFSFFSCSLLLPSTVQGIPSSLAHGEWSHRCAPSTLQPSLSSPLDSFSDFSFLFSLSLAGAFFFLPQQQ